MYYYPVLSYLVLLYVYPITYPVVYVVHVLYCTVVEFQYLKEHDSYQDILLIFQIVPGPKKQPMYPAANACLLPDPVIIPATTLFCLIIGNGLYESLLSNDPMYN
jgi:hypothetical protein